MSISAILWDYDGTLADSSKKNIEVTLEILRHFIPDVDENVPEALSSRSSYLDAQGKLSDWKELYRVCYGLNEEEIRKAGEMWTPTQLKNRTLSDIFKGMDSVLKEFEHVKMGVCSQNGREEISRSLDHHGLLKYFGSIVGYGDVPYDRQKPDPTAFLICLDELKIADRNGTFIYVGDHSVDVAFGRNAESALKKSFPGARVVCAAMHYAGYYSGDDENFPPDFSAKSPEELLEILKQIENETF